MLFIIELNRDEPTAQWEHSVGEDTAPSFPDQLRVLADLQQGYLRYLETDELFRERRSFE